MIFLELISVFLFIISLFILATIKSAKFGLFAIILSEIFLLLNAVNLGILYYMGNFINPSVINIAIISLKGAPIWIFAQQVTLFIAVLLGVILFGIYLYKILRKTKFKAKISPILWALLFMGAVFSNPLAKATNDTLIAFNSTYNEIFMDKFLKNIIKATPKIPKSTKNIIHIYVESFQRELSTEFSDLTPNINALDNKIVFTNFTEASGANMTYAGILSSMCATPSHVSFSTLIKNQSPKLNKCAPTILKDLGYHTMFFKGASLKYQHTNEFLKSLNFDEYYGNEELSKEYNTQNFNAWGIEDNEIFDIAFDKFNKLANNNQPFYMGFITNSTHAPGFVPQICENLGIKTIYNDKILDSMRCSDYLLGEFVQKVRASKWSKNTIIVISADHALLEKFTGYSEKMQTRNIYFAILDDDINGTIAVDNLGDTFDIYPTILGHLGILDEYNYGKNIQKLKSNHQNSDQIALDFMLWGIKNTGFLSEMDDKILKFFGKDE